MNVTESKYVIPNFLFSSGEVLPSLEIQYRTLGSPQKGSEGEIANAVLLLHGTTGSGKQFLKPSIADFLFGDNQPLDSSRYFVIIPDGIGHGGSTKPSGGLKARFPKYTYSDMVQAQHRLVTEELGIKKLRLLLGTSMGGMHTWMWAEQYPDAMRALVPIACVPGPVKGRNLLWRRMLIQAIVGDPGYNGGDYDRQPLALGTANNLFKMMADGTAYLEKEVADLEGADNKVNETNKTSLDEEDANDTVYEFDASKDYDPSGALGKIKAPLLAINFADDELNPAELGVLNQAIPKVSGAQAVLIPAGPKSKGHQTLQVAELWAPYVKQLLDQTAACR